MNTPVTFFAEVRVYRGGKDGTTRYTWHAQADVVPDGQTHASVRGQGTGKKARVAAKNAIERAFEQIRGAG